MIAYDNNKDKEAFRQAANLAIEIATNSELKNHRGAKEILGYAALAVLAIVSVATIGLGFLAAGAINYAVNRQFFFSTTINTDSMNKVLDMKEAVENLAAPAA